MKRAFIGALFSIFAIQNAGASDSNGFFGFMWGDEISNISKLYSLTPLEKSAYRNAYSLGGQPQIGLRGVRNIKYSTSLYFSDSGRLIRALVELHDPQSNSIFGSGVNGAVAPLLFRRILDDLSNQYTVTRNNIKPLIQNYMECGSKCVNVDVSKSSMYDVLESECEKTD